MTKEEKKAAKKAKLLKNKTVLRINGSASNQVYETEHEGRIIRNLMVKVSKKDIGRVLELLPEEWVENEDNNVVSLANGEGTNCGAITVFPDTNNIRVTASQAKGAQKGHFITFDVDFFEEGDTAMFGKTEHVVGQDGIKVLGMKNHTRIGILNDIKEYKSYGMSEPEAIKLAIQDSKKKAVVSEFAE